MIKSQSVEEDSHKTTHTLTKVRFTMTRPYEDLIKTGLFFQRVTEFILHNSRYRRDSDHKHFKLYLL